MQILTKAMLLHQKYEYFQKILDGAIFIYPTDTIYGIGCNAELEEAVAKIREIKEKQQGPFSIIAPSKEWIMENCIVEGKAKDWVEKLPGQYTLVLPLRSASGVAKNVSFSHTLGVRIPNHWIKDIVAELEVPIVTTSVNKTGMPFLTKLEDLEESIKKEVIFFVDEGEMKGKPSTIIRLENNKEELQER